MATRRFKVRLYFYWTVLSQNVTGLLCENHFLEADNTVIIGLVIWVKPCVSQSEVAVPAHLSSVSLGKNIKRESV